MILLNKFSIVLAFLMLLSLNVLAQDTQPEDRVEYSKKTVLDFSDVDIQGELKKPEGSYIKNRSKTRFRNLIELRGNFRPELSRSVAKF